jgi:hypothetical protein
VSELEFSSVVFCYFIYFLSFLKNIPNCDEIKKKKKIKKLINENFWLIVLSLLYFFCGSVFMCYGLTE